MKSAIGLACAAAAVCGLVGCGGAVEDEWTAQRADVVPVSGVVLMGGKPVEGATVNFVSESQQLTAFGLTDADGRFELRTYEPGDGAVPGPHKVTVKKSEVKTVPNPEDPELGPISSEEIWHTPRVYASADTTPLSVEVGPEGESDVKLELKN